MRNANRTKAYSKEWGYFFTSNKMLIGRLNIISQSFVVELSRNPELLSAIKRRLASSDVQDPLKNNRKGKVNPAIIFFTILNLYYYKYS